MALYRPTWKDPKTGETRTASVWWFSHVKDGRKIRHNLGVKDRRAAEMKLAPLLKALERGDAAQQETRATGLDVLVKAYAKELVRRGRTKAHADKTSRRIRRLLKGLARIEDVTPERIRLALARVTDEGDERKGHDWHALSPKTANDFRTALSGLFSFLVREGRWDRNPVASVPRVQYLGPEKPRRSLEPEELAALLSLEKIPLERRLCYMLAASTGLRRSELGSLTWARVDLKAAVVTLPAPDPAPLIAAAEALLARAKPANVTKLGRRAGGAS